LVLSPSRKVLQDAPHKPTNIPKAAANPPHTKNASKTTSAYPHGHKMQPKTRHNPRERYSSSIWAVSGLRRAWCFHQAHCGVSALAKQPNGVALGENTKRGGNASAQPGSLLDASAFEKMLQTDETVQLVDVRTPGEFA
jgi:hypothetical protein